MLHRNQTGCVVTLESGETLSAGAVFLTPPVPQSLALLDTAGIPLPAETKGRLDSIKYESCIAVMASLEGPAQIQKPGGLAPAEGPIAWIADNEMKGVSTTPAVTIHATADFSRIHWHPNRLDSGRELPQAAKPWLGSKNHWFPSPRVAIQ